MIDLLKSDAPRKAMATMMALAMALGPASRTFLSRSRSLLLEWSFRGRP